MEVSVIAACEDCGKRFRVPSADHDYSCKACGGVVTADAALDDDRPDEDEGEERRPARRKKQIDRRGIEIDHHSIRERHQVKSKRNYTGIVIFAGLAVALIGTIIVMSGSSQAGERDGEPDLNKVVAQFDAAWNEGDLEELETLCHPVFAGTFVARMEEVRKNREWTNGFQRITGSTTNDDTEALALASLEDAESSSGRSLSTHETDIGIVLCRWQFNSANECWYINHFDLPPPDPAQRMSEFDTAWNSGDEAGIAPYLQPDKPDKLMFAFGQVADDRGWDSKYPELSDRTIDPDLAELRTLGHVLWYPTQARAAYETEHGAMSMTWKLDRTSDLWYVSSVKPPPR